MVNGFLLVSELASSMVWWILPYGVSTIASASRIRRKLLHEVALGSMSGSVLTTFNKADNAEVDM